MITGNSRIIQAAEEATKKALEGQTVFSTTQEKIEFDMAVLELLGRTVESLESVSKRLSELEEKLRRFEQNTGRDRELEARTKSHARDVYEQVPPEVRAQAQAKAAADVKRAVNYYRALEYQERLEMKKRLEDAPKVAIEWPFPDDTLHFARYSIYMQRGVNYVPDIAVKDIQDVIDRRLRAKKAAETAAELTRRNSHYQELIRVIANV